MEISTWPRRLALAAGGRERVALTPSAAPGAGRSGASAARAATAITEAAADAVLVRRFNQGDEAAFAAIVTRHRERIQRIAERFLHNYADAEEITQDTFIRAHRGLARFRGDSSLATWLHRIAFNLARNRYWYFFRRRRHLTVSLDAPLRAGGTATFTDVVPAVDADPARQATVDEFVALAAACMEKLDAGSREILLLRNRLHRSYDQIALALHTNEGTVKSRIARARAKLRALIAEACPEFPGTAEVSDWFEPARNAA